MLPKLIFSLFWQRQGQANIGISRRSARQQLVKHKGQRAKVVSVLWYRTLSFSFKHAHAHTHRHTHNSSTTEQLYELPEAWKCGRTSFDLWCIFWSRNEPLFNSTCLLRQERDAKQIFSQDRVLKDTYSEVSRSCKQRLRMRRFKKMGVKRSHIEL